MKKVLMLLFLGILLVSFVSAAGLPETPSELEDRATDYLSHEWTDFWEKSGIGRFFLGVSDIFEALSPIFQSFIGVEYSLSWLFFLSLTFWFVCVIVIYQGVRKGLQFDWWIALAVGILIPALAAQFDTFEKFVILWIPLLKNFWTVLLVFIAVVFLVLLYYAFMSAFGKTMKAKNKKETEERREGKAKRMEKIHDIKLRGAGFKR